MILPSLSLSGFQASCSGLSSSGTLNKIQFSFCLLFSSSVSMPTSVKLRGLYVPYHSANSILGQRVLSHGLHYHGTSSIMTSRQRHTFPKNCTSRATVDIWVKNKIGFDQNLHQISISGQKVLSKLIHDSFLFPLVSRSLSGFQALSLLGS